MTRLAEQYIEAHGYSSFSGEQPSSSVMNTPVGHQSQIQFGQRSWQLNKSDRKCYECGRIGHIARDCHNKKRQGPQNRGAALVELERDNSTNASNSQGSNLNRRRFNQSCSENKSENSTGTSSGNHVGSLCILSDKLNDCCVQDN